MYAVKGELWLAKNQDDPEKIVGWIWDRHFAQLTDEQLAELELKSPKESKPASQGIHTQAEKPSETPQTLGGREILTSRHHSKR